MPSHHHHIILLASKVQRTNKGLSNIHTFLCKLDFLPPDHIGGRCRLFRSLRNQYSSVFYHHIGGGGCRLFRSVRLIGAPNKNDLCSSSVMQIICNKSVPNIHTFYKAELFAQRSFWSKRFSQKFWPNCQNCRTQWNSCSSQWNCFGWLNFFCRFIVTLTEYISKSLNGSGRWLIVNHLFCEQMW